MTRLALITHPATADTRTATFGGASFDVHVSVSWSARRHLRAWTSPAGACVRTAAAAGLDAEIEESLRDWDYGRWNGLTLDEVSAAEPAAVRAWLTDEDAAPHGGESLRDVLRRVEGWLQSLEPIAGTVIAVTHPAVVRAAIVAALGAGPSAFWRIDVPPLTETILIGERTRWTLRATGGPPASTRQSEASSR